VRERPLIHGLIEVDVTHARALLRDHHTRTGETVSFTAFVTACVARAVDEHKEVHAVRYGRRHLMVFDDVDVCTRVERKVGGESFVLPYVQRAANRKTVKELHDEVRAAQHEDVGLLSIASGCCLSFCRSRSLAVSWRSHSGGRRSSRRRWGRSE
jgi:hypothetical protein